MEAFVYCWTDHKTNKLYIGSHRGATDDGYVCSSKHMIEEYSNRPEDFTRQIIATGTFSDMRKLESAILLAEDAARNPAYYNLHNADDKFFNPGHSPTEEHRRRIREKLSGVSRPENVKRKISNTLKGHILTEETKAKISSSVSKAITGEGNPMFGKQQSDATKTLMSAKAKNRPRVECVHCGKITDVSNHGRHHGSRCKKANG